MALASQAVIVNVRVAKRSAAMAEGGVARKANGGARGAATCAPIVIIAGLKVKC